MNWVRYGGSATFETKSSYCRVARQGLPAALHGSSTTWFHTSPYCRAKVEFNSINWVQHGSSTTFETGLNYRSVCNILFELLLFAELLEFKATTTRGSFKMAPPQSWPEFKLTNYPGHCVCIIVLSNEYFNQRNLPWIFHKWWPVRRKNLMAPDSTKSAWKVHVLSQSALATLAARTTPGAHAPSLPRTSKILITSLATRCKSICLLEFSRYEWAAAFKILLVALLCGAWIVWFVHWRMFLWGEL